MKYRILVNEVFSREEKRRRFIKWLIYASSLLLFYVIMRCGIFDIWQPVLIIPLAVAVAMHETELPAGIFALFCGYMIDIAYAFIFGFSVVWLMPVAIAASLLVRNLIRLNLFNYCVITAAAVLLEFSMDYLFNVAIWNIEGGEIILTSSIIPTAISTFVLSPLIYYFIKLINRKLTATGINSGYTPDVPENNDDEQSE